MSNDGQWLSGKRFVFDLAIDHRRLKPGIWNHMTG